MNLYEVYSSNEEMEKNGVWFEMSDTVGFKVKKFGGANAKKIQQLQAKYLKPYTRMMKAGKMDEKLERKLYVEIFVDGCLVDWKGVTDKDGKVLEFTRDNAISIMNDLPNLFDEVVNFCVDNDGVNFKEDLGNS